MKPSVYAFGRFIFRHTTDSHQASAGGPVFAGLAQSVKSAAFLKNYSTGFWLVADSAADIFCDALSLSRLLDIAFDTGAGMIYSDFRQQDGRHISPHPLIDYAAGSLRDDFNFGRLFILSAAAASSVTAKYGAVPADPEIALYDLRLKISTDYPLIHVPEFLYTVRPPKDKTVKAERKKTEAHFDYVARKNATRQKKLEKIATDHLMRIGAHLPKRTSLAEALPDNFQWKASIVIPVLNRKKTIREAVKSALSQETDFPFNILVVDNHSTDGTTDILKRLAARHPHLHHLTPARRDLGIGGCWNEALFSPQCGRYAVQLDSDDLYSSPQTLQKMVDKLRKGRLAMVVGAYTLVNEKLKPIAPGLIDHREWTQQNGHNNLLRVNGMGAPRAFDTDILRQIGFPNVSYGEDYAVALRISRDYSVGRIYDSLYWCRRWRNNTDAGLSVEAQNRNDFYKDKLRTLEIKARQQTNRRERLESAFCKDSSPGKIFAEFPDRGPKTLPALCREFFESQKQTWPAFTNACQTLSAVQTRNLDCGNYTVTLQHNPARIVSGSAAVDPESIRKRPCFLCAQNRPADQHAVAYRNQYLILCNPAPIFDRHFTVVGISHAPQEIASSLDGLLFLGHDAAPDYTVFYNGPASGASAPDHLHFQMIPAQTLPFLQSLPEGPAATAASVTISIPTGYDRAIVILESNNALDLKKTFLSFLKNAQGQLGLAEEPQVNVFCFYREGRWRLTIFLRTKHRPDAYYAEGDQTLLISPGAIDMAGVVITPVLHDFENLDTGTIRNIYREISPQEEILQAILKAL